MWLQFFPEPDQEESTIRKAAEKFADTALRPHALHDDEKCFFRREVYNEAAQLGFVSLSMPKQYGGLEKPSRCFYACIEELSTASAAMAVTLGVTNLVQGAINSFGTADQKSNYLPLLSSGKLLGAFSLSEPNAGSDSAALRLKCVKADGGYRITGSKVWCSNAADADIFLVMGRTADHKTRGVTSFVVEKNTPGFRIGKLEKKLGLCSSTLGELVFEDCFIADSQRIGSEGEGLKVALSQLDSGRITIGVAGLAISREAFERTWKYRTELEKTGVPFEEGEQHRLAGYYPEMQALRNLITTASRLKDEKKSITLVASQVKLMGSDLAMKLTSDCVELMRERGYTKEGEVERLMRDAKALQIVEGTNQIQKRVLTREIGKQLL